MGMRDWETWTFERCMGAGIYLQKLKPGLRSKHRTVTAVLANDPLIDEVAALATNVALLMQTICQALERHFSAILSLCICLQSCAGGSGLVPVR